MKNPPRNQIPTNPNLAREHTIDPQQAQPLARTQHEPIWNQIPSNPNPMQEHKTQPALHVRRAAPATPTSRTRTENEPSSSHPTLHARRTASVHSISTPRLQWFTEAVYFFVIYKAIWITNKLISDQFNLESQWFFIVFKLMVNSSSSSSSSHLTLRCQETSIINPNNN